MKKSLSIILAFLTAVSSIACLFNLNAVAETTTSVVETLPENMVPYEKRGTQTINASDEPAIYAVYGSFYNSALSSSAILPGNVYQFDFDIALSDEAVGTPKVYMLAVSNGSASTVNYVAGIRNSTVDPTAISLAYSYGQHNGDITNDHIGYKNVGCEWFVKGLNDGSKNAQKWYEERVVRYPEVDIRIEYPTSTSAATMVAGESYSYSYTFRPTTKYITQLVVVVEGLTAGTATVSNPNVICLTGTEYDNFFYENSGSNYKYALVGALKEENNNVFLRIMPNETQAKVSAKNGGSLYGITVLDEKNYLFNARVRFPAGVAQGTNQAPQFDIYETRYFNYGAIYKSAGDNTHYTNKGSNTQAIYNENGNAYSYNYTKNNVLTYVRRPTASVFSTSQYLLDDGTVVATKNSNASQNGRDLGSALKNYGNVWMNYTYKFTGVEESLIESHNKFVSAQPNNVANLKYILNEKGDGFNVNTVDNAQGIIYPGYAPEGEVTQVALGMHLYNVMDIDIPEFCEYAPDTIVTEENKSGVIGGYITNTGNKYTAVPYKFASFIGWYNDDGELISTDTVLIPKNTGAYYGARFETTNLIKDSGFENYTVGQKLYDSAIAKTDPDAYQPWKIHNGVTAAPLTAWGSLPVNGTYKNSGENSLSMNPPWQIVSTPVDLQPNTEYYVTINYAYNTKLADTYLSEIQFGVFNANTDTNTMTSAFTGSVKSIVPGTDFPQGEWARSGFIFTTDDTVTDNAVFGYVFRVNNPDASATDTNKNNTTLYLDDIVVMPVEDLYSIDYSMKNNATVVPVMGSDADYAVKGDDFCFNVITEPGLTPTVTVGGQILTPDADGVYSFTPSGDSLISVSCGADDEGRPEVGKDYKGRDLTAYNSEVYLENIWEGDTVYQETAMFATGRDTIKLLYPVEEVISLRSYDLTTTYIKGVDFEITADGQIKRLAGSRIPSYAGALTTNVLPDKNRFPLIDDPNTWLAYIGDKTYPNYAISVTYKHGEPYADGYQPAAPVVQNKALNNLLEKLQKGDEVNIVIYGDSISCGWSSSGLKDEIYSEDNETITINTIDVAPYAPSWIRMVMGKLEELYPGQINYKNLALGGKNSKWGMENISARLALWKDENGNQIIPDLIMAGFGVNDSAANFTCENFKIWMKGMVDNARAASGNADMEFLFYSAMLPNQRTSTWSKDILLGYEKALCELAEDDENIGVMKLTSIFTEIIKCKDPLDYLSTYFNHGNDFTARMYATGILAAILGDEPVASAPTLASKTHSVITLDPVEGYEYSKDGTNWQKSNVFTGLNAETEYTFYARVAETNNTYAGPASKAFTVTTEKAPAFRPGNVNDDENGDVNLNDVVALAQVVAGWQDVQHNPDALDVDGSGEVDLEDVVRLAQYVAGWNVQIFGE